MTTLYWRLANASWFMGIYVTNDMASFDVFVDVLKLVKVN